jgi:hypothetical protein
VKFLVNSVTKSRQNPDNKYIVTKVEAWALTPEGDFDPIQGELVLTFHWPSDVKISTEDFIEIAVKPFEG